MKQHYKIAGVEITVADNLIKGHFGLATEPFRVNIPPVKEHLTLSVADVEEPLSDYKSIGIFNFADADAECRFGRDSLGYIFVMEPRNGDRTAKMRIGLKQQYATSNFSDDHNPALIRFGLWMLYNIVAVPQKAVAIHTSVIECNGEAVLFLGESGTGKSTHTRLWRENIEGTTLLNDDSPIVYIDTQGRAMVSGSPWSGKTPCYKDRQLPIRAIVRLSQAPKNRMRRLGKIEAIGALLPSAPPVFVHDELLQDGVCEIISAVISQIPTYHLECLPNAEAAQLAYTTIFIKG